MAVFTWPISNNSAVDSEPRTLQARMGGGYRQVAKDGIQGMPRKVSVEVGPMYAAEAQACHDFLDAACGLPFEWTPIAPLPQIQSWWTATRHRVVPGGGETRMITAEFERFYRPGVDGG